MIVCQIARHFSAAWSSSSCSGRGPSHSSAERPRRPVTHGACGGILTAVGVRLYRCTTKPPLYKALHTGQSRVITPSPTPRYIWGCATGGRCLLCFRTTACLADSIELINSHLLAVPYCPKCSFASRAFCVSSPNNWNSLPLHVRSSDSLATFQSRLKSHLFASAYHALRLRFDCPLLALYKYFIDINTDIWQG